jgi:hypothetical protein
MYFNPDQINRILDADLVNERHDKAEFKEDIEYVEEKPKIKKQIIFYKDGAKFFYPKPILNLYDDHKDDPNLFLNDVQEYIDNGFKLNEINTYLLHYLNIEEILLCDKYIIVTCPCHENFLIGSKHNKSSNTYKEHSETKQHKEYFKYHNISEGTNRKFLNKILNNNNEVISKYI